jgi:monoamine oxidase
MDGQYDVVVVGGGAAGTYAAWRLLTGEVSSASLLPQDASDRSIALCELSNRIGGRLESLLPPGMENLRAEFGGMGFTSADAIVNALIKLFSLAAEEFPLTPNLFYVRGVHFTAAQAGDPTVVPYRLAANEQGVPPWQLVPNAMLAAFPGSEPTWTQEQWAEAAAQPWNGRDLNQLGFWNFLSLNMSNEAFSYTRDAFGHFFEVANWNCREAVPWFMGDGTATYNTLTDGYDQIPLSLAQAFATAGGQTFTSTAVASVQQQTTGPQGQTTMVVTTGNGQTVDANAVILALPRRSLELIDADVLGTPFTQALVASVTGQQVMKVFCCYEQPWWKALEIANGQSGTDLPLGNVWYFGPDSATNESSLLLATYNDTLDTSYWEGLDLGPPFESRTSGDVDPYWASQAPSASMVEEIQTQLGQLHQMTVPDPYSAAWMDWSQDPYGGAFNTWNVGVDADAVADAMLQPDPSVPLYVCGEAYSHDQGWVEGALDTAEQVVEKLGVQAPSWLSA